MAERARSFDVVVAGGGPGGMAAAAIAGESGLRVALVDDAAFAGGQIWRHGGRAPTAARRWLDRLCNVEHFPQSRVIGAPTSSSLLVETPCEAIQLQWKSLVLATGARERFVPFPGWTLPGVLGAGGLQALTRQGLCVRGKRIIFAGSGPLLLAVAAHLRAAGASVPLLLEQAPAARIRGFIASLVRCPSKLLAGVGMRARLLGTRCLLDSYPLGVTAVGDGLHVEYATPAGLATASCDYLACGFHLVPNVELPQLLRCTLTGTGFVQVDAHLRTSMANVYAIGELTGIGGVDKALLEGQIAAHTIAGHGSVAATLARKLPAALAFAGRLDAAFALRPELKTLATPGTVICRCEDVPLSAVSGMSNSRDAKLQTRCGMGPCQGRICGPILQQLLGAEQPHVRPPVFACTIASLATFPSCDRGPS